MNTIFVSQLVFSFLVILMVELLNVNGASSSCEQNPVPHSFLGMLLSGGALPFSTKLFDSFHRGKNVFISPLSVFMTVGMALEGADVSNLNHTDNKLLIDPSPGMTLAKKAYQHYLGSILCPNDNFTLSMANRMYLQHKFSIHPAYTQVLKEFFMSDAEEVDFWNRSSHVATHINQWVKQKTENAIQHIAIPGSTLPDAVVGFINAVFFTGKWKTPFDADRTRPRKFTPTKGEAIQVPTMFVKSHFRYIFNPHINSGVLQLNYAGGRLAMLIVLPEIGTNLSAVQPELSFGSINCLSETAHPVHLYLPKFKVSSNDLMNAALNSLGMSDLLRNMSRLSTNSKIKVSRIAHEAFVGVDEAGSAAVAATAFMFDLHSEPCAPVESPVGLRLPEESVQQAPGPIEFKVDRPFFYLICDITFKQILFMGKLDDPGVDVAKKTKTKHGS